MPFLATCRNSCSYDKGTEDCVYTHSYIDILMLHMLCLINHNNIDNLWLQFDIRAHFCIIAISIYKVPIQIDMIVFNYNHFINI